MTTIYLQHELTEQEIARENAKNAAIAKNRARGAVKRKKHEQREMTEMRHHADAMSDAQAGLIDSLIQDFIALNPDQGRIAHSWFNGTDAVPGERTRMLKGTATNVINRLKLRITEAKQARVTTPQPAMSSTLDSMRVQVSAESARGWQQRAPRDPFADVPNGYYAVDTETGVLAFYRVSTYKSGDRKVQVQASDELHNVKGWKATDAILAKVREATPEAAGLRYAHEIGNCWRCGRTLTDAESLARGIGPVCVNK